MVTQARQLLQCPANSSLSIRSSSTFPNSTIKEPLFYTLQNAQQPTRSGRTYSVSFRDDVPSWDLHGFEFYGESSFTKLGESDWGGLGIFKNEPSNSQRSEKSEIQISVICELSIRRVTSSTRWNRFTRPCTCFRIKVASSSSAPVRECGKGDYLSTLKAKPEFQKKFICSLSSTTTRPARWSLTPYSSRPLAMPSSKSTWSRTLGHTPKPPKLQSRT